MVKVWPHPPTIFLKKLKASGLETCLLDGATWKAQDERTSKLFPGSKLGTWRSSPAWVSLLSGCNPSFYYGVQFCAWFLLKASSQEWVQRESPDSTAMTPRSRSISEFLKECRSAVLGLQRSLWCKAQGKSQANSLPGRWWGWGKGEEWCY